MLQINCIFIALLQLIVVSRLTQAEGIPHQSKAEKISEVRKCLHQASQAASAVKGDFEKGAILRGIAQVQAKASNALHEAFQTASTIGDNTGRAMALASIAAVQAKSGDEGGMKRTFQQAIQTTTARKYGGSRIADALAHIVNSEFGGHNTNLLLD